MIDAIDEVTVHALAGPVGFVDVTTSPPWVTATQSRVVGHEIAEKELIPGTEVA